MKKSEILFGLLRIPTDALAVVTALVVSYQLRSARIDLIPGLQLLEPAQTLPNMQEYLASFVLPGTLLFLIVAALLHLYALRVTRSAWVEMGRIILAALVWVVVVMAWYFLIRKQLFYSRILLIHCAFFITVFVAAMRASLVLVQRELLRMGIGVRVVISIGRRPLAPHACQSLEEDVRYTYLGHFKGLSEFRRFRRRKIIDLVLQTDPNPTSVETLMLADECRNQHIGYAFLPPLFADTPHQLCVDRLGLLPMIRFQPTPLDGWGRVFKRGFDACVGTALLILLSPLFLLIALCILFDSGWPVLYVSTRTGEFGRKKISVLKFRTMVQWAEKKKEKLRNLSHRSDGPLFKVRNDPRVTICGKVLRCWSLDELPQLLNVALGNMSLVGPRPHLPEEVSRYAPEQRRVFAVKPGITGLAQVSGRSDLKFAEEVRLDLQYIEEWSLVLDLWILWRTVVTVLWRRGAD